MNIRELQTRVITRMLRLNQAEPLSSSVTAPASASIDPLSAGGWKVLIYDQYCSDILSPLLSVAELRRLGITLNLNIKQKRETVADTPAIYFVTPTQHNIDLILQDLAHALYNTYHLHFTTSIPRPLLEHLAAQSMQQGSSGRIGKIYDEYCQFVCLEEQLFTFNHSQSYVTLNDTTHSEEKMLGYLETVIDSLFSLIVTIGVVPIIRAQPDGASALVAQRLDEKLRSHLIQRQNLFSGLGINAIHFQRPLLILTDRSIDLTAPLHHTWTYQALLNDLLGLSANRIAVASDDAGPTGTTSKPSKPKSYDLNSVEDKFWKHNAGQPFPAVAAAVQEKVTAFQEEQAKITKSTSTTGGQYDVDVNAATNELSSAINALPKLQKRKRIIEAHTNIATALLKVIRQRDIDSLYEYEQTCMNRTYVGDNRAELEKLIMQEKGNIRDRLRAVLIWMLCQTNINDEQIAIIRNLLNTQITTGKDKPAGSSTTATTTAGGTGAAGGSNAAASVASSTSATLSDLACLDYVKQYRFIHRLTTAGHHHSSSSSSSSAQTASFAAGLKDDENKNDGSWGLFGKLAKDVAKEVVNRTEGVLAGVRNLLPTNTDLPLTKLVDALMNNRETVETDKYVYYDPRSLKQKPTIAGKARPTSTPFKEAVVCVLGGGCYAEYQNLQDYAKKNVASGVQSIVYGCTELSSPDAFLAQLKILGEQQLRTQRGNVPVD